MARSSSATRPTGATGDWDHFVSASYETPAWEKAQTNPEVDAALVRLAPLADRMKYWEGEAEILPGLHTLDAAGHTPGTDAFIISSNGERGVLLGDIVHCQPELLYGWKFPVHTQAVSALQSVERMRDDLVEEQLPCSASHFTGMTWGRVVKNGNGYGWMPEN
ncbi:hypothetical protein [Arthrobacter sp. AZCC_0090]|uniref:hypothetical protein n=1 Tax=Arthrobacter sp. AZCC_0090 TaxID=2735881 RepID=UPI001849D46E|nr:hypothetical protein [Arthrobacter sp. AZCC_0090]MBB6407169.1 glyoxylase-like metal-dependent hydrolase (beta-lactamase superfamily II) [Arthrobacter sp. AZCC_0090]